ncbi:hypothetical protein L249_8664 [Ophiocordyceps polyrhachis-furcata BCC 54312]|uniref:Uncharacterized protein n=1 Tax=Ophiocordyceps polyrhachis-furcata BCC 54312 TaxID=1330021 RepID=A0A367L681_9HYPO|nr:hypothetical protein L249_8664 [Ophiocordyceps polyrhachis-furcata BCC 54312]
MAVHLPATNDPVIQRMPLAIPTATNYNPHANSSSLVFQVVSCLPAPARLPNDLIGCESRHGRISTPVRHTA